ncbi:hypothetical protein BDB00DRAFT_877117 [Zychaea mexicana]|uniref:uncharacterized protein n=1 Tax=Zychaea mexicana TaxID=64656 RepID=UPI0022FF2FD9|nr:uncharacterized protein BDB00DRAFT_877117 [Zychaea mexicana]KAI9488760.1 hypothetical protein BDB00DRAFT_877117 [Zychaea mexicana]
MLLQVLSSVTSGSGYNRLWKIHLRKSENALPCFELMPDDDEENKSDEKSGSFIDDVDSERDSFKDEQALDISFRDVTNAPRQQWQFFGRIGSPPPQEQNVSGFRDDLSQPVSPILRQVQPKLQQHKRICLSVAAQRLPSSFKRIPRRTRILYIIYCLNQREGLIEIQRLKPRIECW